MPDRRVPKAAARAQYWAGQLGAAADGDRALSDMWRWIRSELTILCEQRPQAAEAARWDLARALAAYAARLPKARVGLRRGLEPGEALQLLNPWAERGDTPR